LVNFAKIVGPERVVANTDCGMATTAQAQGIPAEVAWMKLRVLVAGARQASALFYPVPAFCPRPSKRVFYFCSDPFSVGESRETGAERRLILASEVSGKDAGAVASHIRLFIDVPWVFESDGSPLAEALLNAVRQELADGKRNVPHFPTRNQPEKTKKADMFLETSEYTLKSSYQVVVVGSGVLGLLAGKKLMDAGIDVCVLEKEKHVGGIWTTFANETSQVNSSEGSYRLHQDYRERANRDHSSTAEVRADILLIAKELKKAERLFTCTQVEYIEPAGSRADGHKVYSVRLAAGSSSSTALVECQGVVMAVNDRVGKPRPIQWPHREEFAGQVIDGFGGDAENKKIDWCGKRVVIVGMGAFAVENARTALESGASHVTVLARRHGTVCPKFIDYINFVHRKSAENTSAHDGAMDTANNSKNMFLWRKLYETSHSTMPECWLGKIKHSGHTISVSDIWFVAHFLGMLETHVGEISHFSEHGVVIKETGCEIPADVVVRCTGFERNACLVPEISPYRKMSPINYLDENVMYLADAYIDDDAFNSFFGSSVVEMAKFYLAVFVHMFSDEKDSEKALLDPFLACEVSVEHRAWSHYISGANHLVENYPAIKEKADFLVYKRYLDFTETQTPEEYVAANKREWKELHELLTQSKLDDSCFLPYPEWSI